MLYKIFESSIKRLIFPQTAVKSGIPTESRKMQNLATLLRDFLYSDGASKARFRKRRRDTKKAILRSRMPICIFGDGPRRMGKSLAEA